MDLLHTSTAGPLIASLVIVFLAELGDKTLYTLVVLATRNHALPVILGGWAAFLVQGLIAIGLGSLMRLLPIHVVHWATAAIFLGCGIWLLLKRDEAEDEEAAALVQQRSKWRQFGLAFVMVLIAEFGDATQIGSAALVAHFGAPWRVFIGATAGLWLGTVLAVVIGKVLGSRIPSGALRRAAGVVFCCIAVLTAIRA